LVSLQQGDYTTMTIVGKYYSCYYMATLKQVVICFYLL